MRTLRAAALIILLGAAPALAQQVQQYAVPLGLGSNVQGFGAAVPGAAGQPLVSQGAAANPAFGTTGNSGLAAGPANSVKGSLNGTTTVDLPLSPCTALSWTAGVGFGCGAFVRTGLVANTTFNVNVVSGVNQAGCGLAAGTAACNTLPYMVGILQANYDLRGFVATIQLANSTSPTYAPVLISGPWTGGNNVVIQGNLAAPDSVVIDGGGGNQCVGVTNGASVTVQGVHVQNCSQELESIIGSQIYFKAVSFGSPTTGGIGIYCSRQGYCEVIGGGNLIEGIGSNFIQSSHEGNFRANQQVTGASVFTLMNNITESSGGSFAYASSASDITFTGYNASAFNANGFTVTGGAWFADSGGLFQILNATTGAGMTPTFFLGLTGECIGYCSIDAPAHSNPTIGACGGGLPAVGGTDYSGNVAEGTSTTSCSVVFGTPFGNAPNCGAQFSSGPPTGIVVNSTKTGFTVTHGSASSDGFGYTCTGG
jgi:hypothetical protein